MNNLQLRYSHIGLSIILGLMFTLIAINTLHAQGPGDLDTTFNETGVVTTPVGSGHDWGFDITVQPDGKIVAVGETLYDSKLAIALVRYTITGSLDTTFNSTGIVTTSFESNATIQSVAIQPDSKIVVAGYSNNYDVDFTVARYTTNGELDSNFNSSGIVTTPIGSGDDLAGTILLQPDGKMVAVGQSESERYSTEYDVALARYTPAGTLDSTFNGTGFVTTPIGSGDNWGYGAALQPDGKIVVAGTSEGGVSGYDFAVIRYTSDGNLDPSFNNGAGFITTAISNKQDVAFRVAIQPDGKLIVVGYGDSHRYIVVARYTITGTLDSTFNQTGVATVSVNTSKFHEGDGVALQSDGKIIVVGHTCNSPCDDGDFVVLRYRNDGILDSTFNGTGIVTTSVGNNSIGISTAIQPDGKILAVGQSDGDFAVVRYLVNQYVYLPLILKN
jgi:uncharacterized delta-60 repeat protein